MLSKLNFSRFCCVLLPLFFSWNQLFSQPFLTKTYRSPASSGDRIPIETCEVYADRVEITKVYGFRDDSSPVFMAKETVKVSFSDSIQQAIEESAKDLLVESDNPLCKGNRSLIEATTQDSKKFVIYRTGGCDEKRLVREGLATAALRKLVLSYCPSL